MGAKVQAGRREREVPVVALVEVSPPQEDDLEGEVLIVASWFEALSAEWRDYFDLEARFGREAYANL